MRIRLDVAYDGSDFRGWADQPGLRTVQGTLEAALATALRWPAEVPEGGTPLTTVCAGRTDAGVHARGQVVHLDVPEEVLVQSAGRPADSSADSPLLALRRRLDGILPPDVRVRRVVAAPAGFDARFSALWRRYAYRVADTPEVVDPLTRGHVLAHRAGRAAARTTGRTAERATGLDLDALNEASAALLGLRDFASFCKQRVGATTIRTLLDLSWSRGDAGIVVATVRADAFCHHMVRSLVGCLLAVGDGRRPVGWPAEVLAARERSPQVAVVPAHGLTLEEVGYPADDELAIRAGRARTRRTPEEHAPGVAGG